MKTYRSEKFPIARFYHIRHRHQHGVSLVEIMVALAISGIVLAAVLLSVASAARSSAAQTEQSAMVENGQYALNLLSKYIRNAGYESLTAVDTNHAVKDRKRFGRYILGCESGIVGDTAVALPDWGAACNADDSGNDAIAVRYQGGQLTMLPNNTENVTDSGANVNFQALDCSGRIVAATTPGGDGNDITIVDNRFYVNNNNLVCLGNGVGAAPTPIVQNIEQLKITYGVTNRVPNKAGIEVLGNRTVQYMNADYLESSAAPGENPWERVTSVRICVVVRSPNPVPSLPTLSYMNCNGVLQTPPPADEFARKALFTVVEIPNVGPGF